MSAFVVSEEHIKVLTVYALSTGEYGDMRVPDDWVIRVASKDVATLLWDAKDRATIATIYARILISENIRSVHERYPDLPDTIGQQGFVSINEDDFIEYRITDPVQILKLCNCLAYQSCETDDWEGTDAFKLLDAIKNVAITELPGYEEAQWEYIHSRKH